MNPHRSRALWSALLLAVTGSLPGCATNGPDPLESWNRRVFWFNEEVDKYVLEPVATGWDAVLPEVVQTGVRNFFDNLKMPVTLVNDILQLKPLAAAQDLGRIAINTTAGIGGILDVASMLEIPENDEDFGQTLGRYGVPPGAYIEIPLLRSSTLRDIWGIPADAAVTPHVYFVPLWASATMRTVDVINLRASYLEDVREERKIAFDYYVFVRNAYLQNREYKVNDGEVSPSESQSELDEVESEDATDQTPESRDDIDEFEDD